MKSLYHYLDYREFLKDRYRLTKAANPRFSYQKFSKDAGLKSPNYLKLVMDGDRSLTVANIHQFAKALGLTETEHEFFEALVFLTQATNPTEKKYYKSRVAQLKNQRVHRQANIKFDHLGEHPYLPAILVCSSNLSIEEAEKKISKQFNLPQAQVKTVIESLLKQKVLESQNGLLKLTQDYFVQFDKLRSSASQKKFLKAQLDLSSRALEKKYSDDAQFFSHTFTAHIERMPGISKKIADLLEKITNESSDDPPENALQLNLQFFPLRNL